MSHTPHAGANKHEVSSKLGGQEGEGVPIPDPDAARREIAGRSSVATMVEPKRGKAPRPARRRDPSCLASFHVGIETGQIHDGGRIAEDAAEGEANSAALEPVYLHTHCFHRHGCDQSDSPDPTDPAKNGERPSWRQYNRGGSA